MLINNYLLDKLNDSQFEAHVRKKEFAKGAYIYFPPDHPEKIYQVNKGVVKIGSYSSKGEEVCFDIVYDDAIFGNFHSKNSSFIEYAKAATDVEISIIDSGIFHQFIVREPLAYEWFQNSIIDRKNRMEQRIVNIASLLPRERIIHLFQDFDKRIVCHKGKKHWIPDLITDKEIAQLTGLARQTVAKILKSLCSIEEDHHRCKKKERCLKDVLQ